MSEGIQDSWYVSEGLATPMEILAVLTSLMRHCGQPNVRLQAAKLLGEHCSLFDGHSLLGEVDLADFTEEELEEYDKALMDRSPKKATEKAQEIEARVRARVLLERMVGERYARIAANDLGCEPFWLQTSDQGENEAAAGGGAPGKGTTG